MSTEMIKRSDVPGTLSEQMQLAEALSGSGLLPAHLTGKPANLLAIFYASMSVDVPLWQGIQGMAVINGKVSMSADMMRALILRAGHQVRVEESTETAARVVVVRRGEDFEHIGTFTEADARKAGLWGNRGPWTNYTRAMLVARATTIVARQACADVLAGMSYSPEELGAEVDEDGRVIEAHRQVEVRVTEPARSTRKPKQVEVKQVEAATEPTVVDAEPAAPEEKPLVGQIIDAGQARGIHEPEDTRFEALFSDFSEWSKGGNLRQASDEDKRGYLAHLLAVDAT